MLEDRCFEDDKNELLAVLSALCMFYMCTAVHVWALNQFPRTVLTITRRRLGLLADIY